MKLPYPPKTILLELGRGASHSPGKSTLYDIVLWEMPENFNGSGIGYTISGKPYHWSWCNPDNSLVVDFSQLPPEIEFSFYHGVKSYSTPLKEGTVVELFTTSDYRQKAITKERIVQYEYRKTLKIISVGDMFVYEEELKKSGLIPSELLNAVINSCGLNRTIVKNGERGIAMM